MMKLDRKELVNPVYYGMLSYLNNTVTQKALKKSTTTFALPHGIGAGASTAIATAIAYGMETEAECRNGNIPKSAVPATTPPCDPSNGKQSRRTVGDAVFLCNSYSDCRKEFETFWFALNKMGIEARYDALGEREILRRTDGNRILFLIAPEQYVPIQNHKVRYIVFNEAQKLDGMVSIASATDYLLKDGNSLFNTFSFIDYHVPASSSHWINSTIGTQREDCNFHRISGTCHSMRKEWLGEGFFYSALCMSQRNIDAYRNKYLCWQTEY